MAAVTDNSVNDSGVVFDLTRARRRRLLLVELNIFSTQSHGRYANEWKGVCTVVNQSTAQVLVSSLRLTRTEAHCRPAAQGVIISTTGSVLLNFSFACRFLPWFSSLTAVRDFEIQKSILRVTTNSDQKLKSERHSKIQKLMATDDLVWFRFHRSITHHRQQNCHLSMASRRAIDSFSQHLCSRTTQALTRT
jgi:hypothetical protein